MKFSEEVFWAIELADIYAKKDLKVAQRQLVDLLDLLVHLHEVLAEKNVQVEDNEVLSEELIMKFYLHGLTVGKISDTYKLTSKYYDHPNMSKVDLIDISSLLTVGRAQLETLLMYQHLYVNSSDKDEQKLRYYAWIYTALIQRSTIPVNNDESKIQKEKDEKSIADLKVKMENSAAYKNLSPKQQNSLLISGSGKLFKHWEKIFDESGFLKDSPLAKIYYILSVYSHSEGLSVIQMKSAKYFITHKNNSEMTFMQIFSSIIMTSIMIKNIVKKYELVSTRFAEIDKKTKFEVEFFSKLGKSNKPNA